MSRRTTIGLFAALGALGITPSAVAALPQSRFGPPVPFGWEGLVDRARKLARGRYVVPSPSPRAAADFDAAVRLTYGDAPAIAGNVRLLPASRMTAPAAVEISVVENGMARVLADSSGLFIGAPGDPAGFRVMSPGGNSDWLAFQGASYFRSSGSRDQYGISARAVAIDTGTDRAEEFPAFTHFWLEHTGANRLRIHALLDGPSITGAFAFDCALDANGVTQDVTAALFARRDIAQLGIAAASSMFWYDQARQTHGVALNADWRPEIHDSDGLAIFTGTGERIWRPLSNPAASTLHSLRADSPRAFGLLQRDQDFDHYQDDGAFYERRPSLWVEPKGDWGPGAVCLYEMATDSETQDNIASFWRSDRPLRAGQSRQFAYRLSWTSQDPTASAAARCIDHFEGAGGIPGAPPVSGVRKFVFDFTGASLAGLDRDSGVTPANDIPPGALVASAAYPVARQRDLWRVTLDVRTAALSQPQFRLHLKRGNDALSETVIRAVEPKALES